MTERVTTSRGLRVGAALLFAFQLGACKHWKPAQVSPRQVIETEQPDAIRIMRSDSTRVQVEFPAIVNDTIVAQREECSSAFSGVRETCVPVMEKISPLADVIGIDVRRTHLFRTTYALVVVVGGLAALALSSMSFTPF